ncbi:MAG: hypothetical protein JSV32_00820 [Dehalococcoidia bacterium]|nr:MAG: hypothetical protein JSV32_00820 [Dehalococcoidia bacterium]
MNQVGFTNYHCGVVFKHLSGSRIMVTAVHQNNVETYEIIAGGIKWRDTLESKLAK